MVAGGIGVGSQATGALHGGGGFGYAKVPLSVQRIDKDFPNEVT